MTTDGYLPIPCRMKRSLFVLAFITTFLFLPHSIHAQENQTVTNGEFTKPVEFPAGSCVYRWANSNSFIGLGAGGVGNIAPFKAINNLPFTVTATFTAEPQTTDFAYIANYGSNNVSVVSTLSNTVVATIPVGQKPFGVSVSPDESTVYITNEGDNTVSVINTTTNMVTGTIQVGAAPHGVVASPDGKFIYVANSADNNITVCDVATGQTTATIPVGKEPYGVAVSPDGGKLYASNYRDGTASAIDLSTMNVIATISTGYYATGIAVTPDGKSVFVGEGLATWVTKINAADNTVVKNIGVISSSYSIAMDRTGTYAYVGVTGYIVLIDLANDYTIGTSYGGTPKGISVTSDGLGFVMTDYYGGLVEHSTRNLSENYRTPVGANPVSLGNFIVKGKPCTTDPVTFTITINPTQVRSITASPITGHISACTGTVSASPNIQQFKVSGSVLTAGITVTAPAGFEVSLFEGSSYVSALSIPQNGGNVSDVTVYVRAAASTAAGVIKGNVILSSTGVNNQTVAVSGVVKATPLVINPGNRTEENGIATQPVIFAGLGNKFTWVNDNPGIGLAASGDGELPIFTPVNTGKTPITAHVTVTPASIGYAYLVAARDNKVLVVNRQTNAIVADIPIGRTAAGIALSPNGTKLFVANFTPGSSAEGVVSVINTATNKIFKTINVGSGPYGVAVTPDGRFVYVANQLENRVAVIDVGTYSVVSNIAVGRSPVGVAVSADGQKVYVGNVSDNTVSVINTSTNRVSATFAVGATPYCILPSPDGSRVYVTNSGSNSVSVIDAVSYSAITTIPVSGSPNSAAITPDGSRVYVCFPYGNIVSVINTATNAVESQIFPGQTPNGVDVSSDGKELFIEASSSHSVTVYDVETGALKTTISTGAIIPATIGKFLWDGSDCPGAPVNFDITVNATIAMITAGPATGTIAACQGSTSVGPNTQKINVAGSRLTAGILATASAGFEVSLNLGNGYGNTVLIPQTNGVVANTTVFVRLLASGTIGAVSGNVILSSADADDVPVRVSAFVNALPAVNNPGNQSLQSGAATTPVIFTGTGNNYTWRTDNANIGLIGNGTGDIPSFTAVNTGSTPAVATITVTPQLQSFIYIANAGDNTVSVLDYSGKLFKTIPVGRSPYGVSISPNGTRIYVSNILDKSVSVINSVTNEVVATIPVGDHPYGISVSPDGRLVYVANEVSNSVSVINGVTNEVIKEINVGQYPTFTAVSPDGGKLYVANQNSKTISIINTVNHSLITEISTLGYEPSQMALSPDGGMLYTVGLGSSTNAVFVINTSTYENFKIIPLDQNPHGIAITPDGGYLYVTNTGANNVFVINTATLAATTSIPVGAAPNGVSVSSNGEFVYVVNGGDPFSTGSVSVIGAAIAQVLYTVPVGKGPVSIGNFIAPPIDCPGDAVDFTITVASAPPPTFAIDGTFVPFTTVYGTPSLAERFTVSGTNIVSGITITAATGFEVSTDNVTFSSAVTIAGSGTVSQRPAYIRLAATSPVGVYDAHILVTIGSTINVTVTMPNGTVTPAPLVATADDKTRLLGAANPVFTASYSGFVNNENAYVITRQPDITTTATVTSEAGQYPIIANNADALNYTFSYVQGVLTIQPSLALVTIPNTFTPNDDGVNDTWNLQFLQDYTRATVMIFNKWGNKVYSSIGYPKPWDGKRNGAVLAAGTYYYIIDPKDGEKPLTGWVAILR